MMPVVRISDAAFADLRNIATWLKVETPSQAIDRIVRREMERLGLERDDPTAALADPLNGKVPTLEDSAALTFTRVLAANVDGRAYPKTNWSGLLIAVVERVCASGLRDEHLATALQVPARVGKYEEYGFKYYQQIGISIQGQSATDAWKEVARLATRYNLSVEVEFQWRENEKALHPGRIAKLRAGK